MANSILRVYILFILTIIPIVLSAIPKININDFIADTLLISLPVDSGSFEGIANLKVMDDRVYPGSILGIEQTKVWKYIPVDQYIVLQHDLANILNRYILRDSLNVRGTLYIKNVTHWYDGGPIFSKGRKLNAYTILEDSSGNVVSDWLWEFSLKPKKKQKNEIVVGNLMDRWLSEQVKAIRQQVFHHAIYPYFYRRQLINWWDVVILQDGYILNTHLTLDFPADQLKSWIRGAPGVFYRKGKYHQSIAIGGKDQQWYARINEKLVRRLNVCYRFGFNNFDKDKYNHLDFWNIFLVNISANASVEYRPVYLKGLFFGLGVHTSLNILPEIINRIEPGLLLTAGFILP